MLSSCPECWDTPCVCGHEYEEASKEYKIKLASAVLGMTEEELLKYLPEGWSCKECLK